MIQISNVNKLKDTTSTKGKTKTSGGNFSEYLKDVMQTSSNNVSGVATFSATDAIFATQMVGEEEEKELRKKQIKRAQSLLEKLEEIRDSLLLGYVSKDRLIEISRFVKERKFEAQDERLNQIVDEIELRIEVELAKLMK